MFKKNTFQTIVLFVVSLTIILSTLLIPASATNEDLLPKGDSIYYTKDETLVEQFNEMLQNCTSLNERTMILFKANQMGLTSEDFNEVDLSENDLLVLNGQVNIDIASDATDRAIIEAQDNASEKSKKQVGGTRTVVAGVDMPSYALMPTISKQATSTYCSAATVHTVGTYISATPKTQAQIMADWQTYWGVTYPDLPLVRNYMNNKLSGKPSTYVNYVVNTYGGNQTTFNTDLKNNVLNYQPMILLLRHTSSDPGSWPYNTSGHFCVCNGLLTWENNRYFIGDPYFFLTYCSNATNDNGQHKRTWSQLNTAITNKFGSGSQKVLT